MIPADDPGLDPLHAALQDRHARRRRTAALRAAALADLPMLALDSPEALAVQDDDGGDLVPAPGLDEHGRRAYWIVRGLLERHGQSAEVAGRVAWRCAGALELAETGYDRREWPARLGVTERTLERDRGLLRAAGGADALAEVALELGEALPPIPRERAA